MNLADFYAARNRTSGFMDPDYGGDHWGQDFNSASRLPAGTPIPSLSTGRVVRNSWQDAHGWYIAIQADQPGWYWTYSHRQSGGGFDIGELIQKGESVGQLGNTGWSTAPHVHVQYTQYPDPWQHTWSGTVDPWPYIQQAVGSSWAGNGDDDMYDAAAEERLKAWINDQTRPNLYRNQDTGAIAAVHIPSGYWRVFANLQDLNTFIGLDIVSSQTALNVGDSTFRGLRDEALLRGPIVRTQSGPQEGGAAISDADLARIGIAVVDTLVDRARA